MENMNIHLPSSTNYFGMSQEPGTRIACMKTSSKWEIDSLVSPPSGKSELSCFFFQRCGHGSKPWYPILWTSISRWDLWMWIITQIWHHRFWPMAMWCCFPRRSWRIGWDSSYCILLDGLKPSESICGKRWWDSILLSSCFETEGFIAGSSWTNNTLAQ